MKVGVLLAGCGVQDGSEIYEAILTLLALERGGASVQVIAPDVEQANVINHYTGDETRLEARNVLAESARIVRGKITSMNEVSAHDIDALVIPGGTGVLKNLCSYASAGVDARVNPAIERLIQELHGLGKPIGAISTGPILVALALRNAPQPAGALMLTAGSDGISLARLGVAHSLTTVDEIYTDANNKVVSTAGFLLGHSASEVEPSITKLVDEVLRLAHALGPGHIGEASTTTFTTAP